MNAAWLRLVYILELLLAVPAIYTLRGQVGGQGHLDIMPWYWKLSLGCGGCLAVVQFTRSIIERERFWSGATIVWFGCILFVAILMGAATYYYHLHESPEETDSEESTTAARVFGRDCWRA